MYVCEECGHSTDQPHEYFSHLQVNHPDCPTLSRKHDKRLFKFSSNGTIVGGSATGEWNSNDSSQLVGSATGEWNSNDSTQWSHYNIANMYVSGYRQYMTKRNVWMALCPLTFNLNSVMTIYCNIYKNIISQKCAKNIKIWLQYPSASSYYPLYQLK